jgi:glycosyltransferase involved in cell wall biosynthesis
VPHLIYLAIGFPPAVKSCAWRMRETANLFAEAGWDVTAVTIHNEGWEREFGVDPSLSVGVHPRIRVVKLPLSREDLEPDIRTYSEFRARQPRKWLAELRRREVESFPEIVFGSWRVALEEGVLAVHAERPADLMLVSPAPNAGLAAAWRLWSEQGVPYAVDYRDAWSLNVLTGEEAFPVGSRAGEWEQCVIEHANAVWCVNEAIADFYRYRYPKVADRIQTVQNGFDALVVSRRTRRPDRERGLTFGYVGTANFPADMLTPLVEGWRRSRATDPLLGRSRLVFRGHFGAGFARGATRHVAMISTGAIDGVSYDGPAAKSELADFYGQCDALVLILAGGRYVTAGKTYEYVASGLPIMSVHAEEHGAAEILADYPLWVPPPVPLDADTVAASFRATARLVVETTDDLRARAAEYGRFYERRAMLAPAVRALVEAATGKSTSVART